MAQLLPPHIPISPEPPPPPQPPISTTPASPPPPPSPSQLAPSHELPTTAVTASAASPSIPNTSNSLAPKRQRRPSVRLGEIGHQKSWRFHKYPSLPAKTSKTRPLTNLVNGHPLDYAFHFGSSKRTTKSKNPTKRLRSNWASSSAASAPKFENDGVFRDENQEYDEGSDSPLKEQSPVRSMDNQNVGFQYSDRRAVVRARRVSGSEGLEHHQNNLNFHSNEVNYGDDNRSSGVKEWLIGLGMGRYAPVFEIHEVDDEVLPMLTLEDLKDMGINAVGSRRRMYSAILKLRKGPS